MSMFTECDCDRDWEEAQETIRSQAQEIERHEASNAAFIKDALELRTETTRLQADLASWKIEAAQEAVNVQAENARLRDALEKVKEKYPKPRPPEIQTLEQSSFEKGLDMAHKACANIATDALTTNAQDTEGGKDE